MLDGQWRAVSGRHELIDLCDQRRSNGCRLTNLVYGNERVFGAADRGLLRTLNDDPGGIILFEDRDVQRLYFIQESLETATSALRAVGSAFNCRTVVDLTARNRDFVDLEEALAGAGFDFYKCFRRMSRKPAPTEAYDLKEVRSAQPDEIAAVLDLIMSVFDPLAEFLPTLTELELLMERGGILVVTADSGKLRGFLVHEAIGSTSLLRYIAVSENERGKGLAASLITGYLNETKSALRHDLWVWEHNDPAIKHYLANGFSFTGPCNATFLFRG